MALTRSKTTSIFTPEGNSLAVFIDVNGGELKLKDVFGGVELFSDLISGGGGLNLLNDVVISATLTQVVDKDNTPSILSLSTESVGIGTTTPTGILNLFKPSAAVRLMINGDTAQNKLISFRTGGLQRFGVYVNNTGESGSNVGSDFALRRYTDGGTLGGTPLFVKRSTGNVGINSLIPAATLDVNGTANIAERLTIEADSTATTQSTAVIQNTTLNSGIALVANGTGAITADIPDGTIVGGNARGNNAVDLQTERGNADQVASARSSVIVAGTQNRITSIADFSGILGGNGNVITGQNAVISGGSQNSVGSNFSTVSGGQSNSALTGTHATVVGGQSNVSSGIHSVSGGQSNTASGSHCIVMGNTNLSNADQSISIGGKSNGVTEIFSANIGGELNNVNGRHSANLSGKSNTIGRFNSSGNICLAGSLNIVNNTAGTHSVAQGFRNTVNGESSGVFGTDNTNTGSFSYAFGRDNRIVKSKGFAIGLGGASYMSSMFSHGNGDGLDQPFFVSAQSSEVLATNQQTVTSGNTITLFLDGANGLETIQPNNKPSSVRTVYNTFAKWVAIVQTASGTTDVAVGDIITSVQTFAWKDNAAISSIVGVITTISTSSDVGMASASMAYSIGASQELVCTFTAPTFTGVGATVKFKVLNVLQFAEMSMQS